MPLVVIANQITSIWWTHYIWFRLLKNSTLAKNLSIKSNVFKYQMGTKFQRTAHNHYLESNIYRVSYGIVATYGGIFNTCAPWTHQVPPDRWES